MPAPGPPGQSPIATARVMTTPRRRTRWCRLEYSPPHASPSPLRSTADPERSSASKTPVAQEFTGKVFISTPRTPDRRTHRCKFNTARGPQDPLTTAVLDQPPGRAAKRLAPPGRLKRDLNQAHLHLGDLLPDPLRVAHLRRSCELLRVVYKERLGARARPSVDGAVARARAPFARSARRRMK